METNGKVSVMPKAEYAPATNGDNKNKVEDSFLPIILISEGKLMKDNLKVARLDEEKVNTILKKQKVYKIKDVLLLSVDQSGQGYIQTMKGEGREFATKRLVA